MWQLFGKFKEQTGNTVHKAILLRDVGGRWRQLAKHYYNGDETFWKYKKERAYELHPDNAQKEIGNTRIEYIDYETGAPIETINYNTENPLKMKISHLPVYGPQALFKMLAGEHIKQAGKSVMGGNTNLIMCLLCIAIGVMLGLLVGMNMDSITGAFAGNKTQTVPHALALLRGLLP